ncbi:MAG: 5-oxoprolinase [Phototrophicales bacterium]|nr:MAG: 5-oxoprolinase [Phototrophicales bacterium]
MVDSISLGVFRSLFESAAEEMGVTLQRAALSPNIRERLDFSCAIFDAQARMIAQAAHIPVHLGSMPASVSAAVSAFDRFQPGDVMILNDPYAGGTHLPDVTMISPVFLDESAPLFFVASRAHHADIGGMSPGSLPLSTELYQEGLIIPPIKLVDAGQRREDVLKLIIANSRTPSERLGDFEAQLAAQRAGERRLRAYADRFGVEPLINHADALIAYARRMTEAIIASIPDGTYRFCDALDGDGQREYPIPICTTITVSETQMRIDFDGTSPQVAGNLNAVTAIARSASWYCIRLLARDDIPVNHGCFEPVEVVVPPHSLLNPDFPAAVAVGNTETGQRIVDVVLGALAQALPDRVPAASQGSMNNITVGGAGFVYYETIDGGHGGSPNGDGLSGRHSHMTNTRNTPIEALEYALPMRVWQYRLRDRSGGAGHFSGGHGVIREYEFLSESVVTINSERRLSPPYGLAGGQPGNIGVNVLITSMGEQALGGKWTGRVRAGDRIRIETPGGGGWGSPVEDSE